MKREEIRRKVGELLGYRVEGVVFRGQAVYRLMAPNGLPYGANVYLRSEQQAWRYLPRCERDIAAAWQVVGWAHNHEDKSDFMWEFSQVDWLYLAAEEAALQICLLGLELAGVEVGEVEED